MKKKGFKRLEESAGNGSAIYQAEVVFSVEQGKRTVLGTDWPIKSLVSRETYGGKTTGWVATYGLCNGIPAGSKRFKTKREAIDSLA